MSLDRRRHLIGGSWVAVPDATTLPVENPATATVIAEIALAGTAEVDAAVAAARAAFPRWSGSALAERRGVLQRLLALTRDRLPDLAAAVTAEMGAPATLALQEQAGVAVSHLEAFLAALDDVVWEERLANGDTLRREPIGVCALITPWNWPLNQITLKVLAAIAAGCTCVLKPSEQTPLSAMLYAEMLDLAGLPPGVVNLINGTGPEAGGALAAHPAVDMVSFTGSTRAGAEVSRAAAPSVKRVTLELGGKSPNLVFADCGPELEARVRASVAECFLNTGQSCDAPSRMLAEAASYDEVCRIAADAARRTAVGDPGAAGPHLGPLASAAQWDRVQQHIATAIDEGARLLVGGLGRPPDRPVGHFARPTVFADVDPAMALWREEVFGPVLAIAPFRDEAEAIRLANDSDYGLAAFIQTGAPERARRVARALRAGMVRVNGAVPAPGSPFGGYRRSGNGREGGRLGIEEFLEIKALQGIS